MTTGFNPKIRVSYCSNDIWTNAGTLEDFLKSLNDNSEVKMTEADISRITDEVKKNGCASDFIKVNGVDVDQWSIEIVDDRAEGWSDL